AFQDAGEAPPPGLERRRPLDRGSVTGDHPGLQVSEIGRLPLNRARVRCLAWLPCGPSDCNQAPEISYKLHCCTGGSRPGLFLIRSRPLSEPHYSNRISGLARSETTEDQ